MVSLDIFWICSISCSYLVASQMCTECIEQRLWARFGGGRRAQSHRFPTQPSLASHHTAMSSHRAGIAWPLCTMQSPRPSKCIHYPHGKIPWLEIDACCILCVCEVWLFPCLSIWMSCHDKSTLIVCTISALETQWRKYFGGCTDWFQDMQNL